MDNRLIITDKNSYDIYTIKAKISDYLKDREYFVDIQSDYITFKLNPTLIASGNPGWRYKVFKILKEGKIKLDKHTDSIEITWKAKVDSLYFIAFCIAIFVGLFAWLFIEANFKISSITSVSAFILFIFIGRFIMKIQINELIKKNTYYNYQ